MNVTQRKILRVQPQWLRYATALIYAVAEFLARRVIAPVCVRYVHAVPRMVNLWEPVQALHTKQERRLRRFPQLVEYAPRRGYRRIEKVSRALAWVISIGVAFVILVVIAGNGKHSIEVNVMRFGAGFVLAAVVLDFTATLLLCSIRTGKMYFIGVFGGLLLLIAADVGVWAWAVSHSIRDVVVLTVFGFVPFTAYGSPVVYYMCRLPALGVALCVRTSRAVANSMSFRAPTGRPVMDGVLYGVASARMRFRTYRMRRVIRKAREDSARAGERPRQ